MRISLNGKWVFSSAHIKPLPVTIPGSVLSGLLENGIIQDPYYRDNEEKAKSFLMEDYVFVKRFSLDSSLKENHNFLCFDGIDTVAEIFLNGVKIGESFDMHLPQRIELDNELLKEENELCLKFESPYRYIEEYPDPRHVFETYAVTEKRPSSEKRTICSVGIGVRIWVIWGSSATFIWSPQKSDISAHSATKPCLMEQNPLLKSIVLSSVFPKALCGFPYLDTGLKRPKNSLSTKASVPTLRLRILPSGTRTVSGNSPSMI